MNECTIAIWRDQNTGLLVQGFVYQNLMMAIGYGGSMQNIAMMSYDPTEYDFWSYL